MKHFLSHLLSLLGFWFRALGVLILIMLLLATVQQLDESDIARAGGFWSTR